jgi:flagellar hook protein FlgE
MSFQQGLSGLNATSKNLQVIGNNIANANTFGTKVSRAEFADMYASALSGAGSSAIGIGTKLATVAQQFTQGNIKTTENPMDLSINGAGFFQVGDGASPVTYTRNGQFKVDRDGYIVNNAGLRLMGYAADGLGQIQPGLAVALQLPTGGVAPTPTTEVSLRLNLDSRGSVTVPSGTPAIDFSDAATYNNATSLTVYDLQGREVALTYYFQKSGNDTWNLFATANGATLADYLQFEKDANSKLALKIDHNGGSTFTPTATVVFDNVTVNISDQLVVNGQFISGTSGNLTLATVIGHLRDEGQLVLAAVL